MGGLGTFGSGLNRTMIGLKVPNSDTEFSVHVCLNRTMIGLKVC